MKKDNGIKKHFKKIKRKNKLKDRKIKEKNKKAIEILLNLEKMETKRRKIILEYLKKQGYIQKQGEEKSISGTARFYKNNKLYLLKKINLAPKLVEDLEKEAAKFLGLYAIQQSDDGIKGEIFQIFQDKKGNFFIKKIFDEKNIKIKSKK